MREIVLPRALRRSIFIGLTLAVVVGVVAVVPIVVMHERHLAQQKQDLLDELVQVRALDEKARHSLPQGDAASEPGAASALASLDATASAAHIQAVVHEIGAAPIVIASIRNLPPVPGPVLSASRAAVELVNVPEQWIGSVVSGLEHATPPVMIESLRIVSPGAQMPDGEGGPATMQVTATLRAYFKTELGSAKPASP